MAEVTSRHTHLTLTKWKREGPAVIPRGDLEGVSFSTDGTSSGNKGPRCWTCREYGHIKWHCPKTAAKKEADDTANVQTDEVEEEAPTETGDQLLINAVTNGEYDENAHFSFLELGDDRN